MLLYSRGICRDCAIALCILISLCFRSRAVVLPQKAGPLHGPSSSEDEDEDSSETNSVQETLNSMVDYIILMNIL